MSGFPTIRAFLPQAVFAVLLAAGAVLHALQNVHSEEPASPGTVLQLCSGYDCPPGNVANLTFVFPMARGNGDFWLWQPAVYLAPGADSALLDLYSAEFRVTSDGRLREMRRARNLSVTNDADENILCSNGTGQVAFAGRSVDGYGGVNVLGFKGESPRLTSDWPLFWRMANRINNFQSTGFFHGIHQRGYRFAHSAKAISLRAKDGGFAVESGSGVLLIESNGRIAAGRAVVNDMVKGRPAFLAWAVDTVRAIPWVGRTKIEWLEKFWFEFDDWLTRTGYALKGAPDEDPQATAALASRVEKVRLSEAMLVGWPPSSIPPILSRGREGALGEGIWLPVDSLPMTDRRNGPPLFYESFIRVDSERPYSRAQMVAWDPSRVSLHMMAGVREPQSTTGVRGKGEIPRDSQGINHVTSLVAAFNGAFQALHGEWGMVQNREVLLPLRPYGASVAVFSDGRVGMGSWPYPEPLLPENIVDVRQNIHAVVENGGFNPYGREWWGGVPQGIEERVVTTRTGLCLTKTGKMIYFWGRHLSPESLGAAMLAADCDFGMHLDMNSGHCGFEYYRVDRTAEIARYSGSLQKKMEVIDAVPGRSDLAFVARKLVEGMGSMRFPRYINRDPRDFFYLTVNPSIFDNPPEHSRPAGWRPLVSDAAHPVAGVMVRDGDGAVYKFDPGQIAISVESEKPQGESLLSLPYEDAVVMVDGSGSVLVTHASDRALLDALATFPADKLPGLRPLEDGKSQWLVIRAAPRAAWERLFPGVKPVPPSQWREIYRKRGRLLKPDVEDAPGNTAASEAPASIDAAPEPIPRP